MELFVKYIGWISILFSALYGAYKFLLPFLKSIQTYRKIVSVENINHNTEVAYRALLKAENLNDHVGTAQYICTPDGSYTYASKRLCEIFEKNETDMLGFGWTTAIVQEDRDRAFHKWMDCVKERIPYEDTYHIKSKNLNKNILITTTTKVCFKYDAIEKRKTDEILFYIGTVVAVI